MKKSVSIVLSFVLLAVPMACENSYPIYSNAHRAYFVFDPKNPPYNVVTSVGSFISVRALGDKLTVTDGNRNVTKWPMSEQDVRIFSFGFGGLIIGTPALDNDYCLVYAYDLACPACDDFSSKLSRLDFGSDGVTECPLCHAKFDLNNGGIVISAGDRGEARPLYRYPVTQSGQFISIAN